MTIDRESLRPAFERVYPAPEGLAWDETQQAYVGNGFGSIRWTPQLHAAYQGRWEGFCAAFESLGEPVYIDAGDLRQVMNGNDMPASASCEPTHGMVAHYRIPEVQP